MRRLAPIVVLIVLVGSACLGGGSTAHTTGGSTDTAAALSSVRWQRFSDSTVSFRYPSAWRSYRWQFMTSFSNALVYLSTGREHNPCVTTTTKSSETVRCHSALAQLEPAGVFVTWMQWGMPAMSYKHFPGKPSRIGGRPARIHVGGADRDCTSLGGQETITAYVASRVARDNWIAMIACLRGPNLATSTAQVEHMLATTTWLS